MKYKYEDFDNLEQAKKRISSKSSFDELFNERIC